MWKTSSVLHLHLPGFIQFQTQPFHNPTTQSHHCILTLNAREVSDTCHRAKAPQRIFHHTLKEAKVIIRSCEWTLIASNSTRATGQMAYFPFKSNECAIPANGLCSLSLTSSLVHAAWGSIRRCFLWDLQISKQEGIFDELLPDSAPTLRTGETLDCELHTNLDLERLII